MNVLDLPESLIFLILSFYLTEPKDIVVLRDCGNKSLFNHFLSIKNIIFGLVWEQMFSVHVDKFPELKRFTFVPSIQFDIPINDNYTIHAISHDILENLVNEVAFKDYVKYLLVEKARLNEMIKVSRVNPCEHIIYESIYYERLLYFYLKKRYIKNWTGSTVDEVLEHVFSLRTCFSVSESSLYFLELFGVKEMRDVDSIYFEPFSKWTWLQMAAKFHLVIVKIFDDYEPKSKDLLNLLSLMIDYGKPPFSPIFPRNTNTRSIGSLTRFLNIREKLENEAEFYSDIVFSSLILVHLVYGTLFWSIQAWWVFIVSWTCSKLLIRLLLKYETEKSFCDNFDNFNN